MDSAQRLPPGSTQGTEVAERLSRCSMSGRLGHAAGVAAGIVRGRFDRRRRKRFRCVGKQLGWVVRYRLVRIDRARLWEWRNHAMSKPAGRVASPLGHRAALSRRRCDRSARSSVRTTAQSPAELHTLLRAYSPAGVLSPLKLGEVALGVLAVQPLLVHHRAEAAAHREGLGLGVPRLEHRLGQLTEPLIGQLG